MNNSDIDADTFALRELSKLNLKTVFLLTAQEAYKSMAVVDVFGTKEAAEKRKTRIESRCAWWKAEMKRTDYEANIRPPECLNEVLTISEWKVKG